MASRSKHAGVKAVPYGVNQWKVLGQTGPLAGRVVGYIVKYQRTVPIMAWAYKCEDHNHQRFNETGTLKGALTKFERRIASR